MVHRYFAVGILVASLTAPALAAPYTYVNWDLPPITTTAVHGTISAPGSSVGVNLTGGFADVVNVLNVFSPATTYSGGGVDNAPDTGAFVKVNTMTSFSLSFSKPVAGIVIDLWSVGDALHPITYSFDQPFTLAAAGPNSSFGGLPLVQVGNTVIGAEGNGALLFGAATSLISFQITGTEDFSGFTVGVPSSALVLAPEPTTLFAGSAATAVFARRRRRA